LADDSGLEVDYLQGAPGIYSARYAGVHGDEQACNELLLHNMRNAPQSSRSARFKAAVALASPEKVLRVTTGVCEGHIGFAPKGDGGFGYDPLFILAGDGRTTAEMSDEEKNNISHRGKALAEMAPFLSALLRGQIGTPAND
jgi:XTP/dITP diphosphohydrolase